MTDGWTDWRTDRQTNGQTDQQTVESDFIGHCPTNVERPIPNFNDQINYFQEELESKVKIIKILLLHNVTNIELQSRIDIDNTLIDASLQTKQKSCDIDTKKLLSDKSNAKDKNNCLEKDDTEQSPN